MMQHILTGTFDVTCFNRISDTEGANHGKEDKSMASLCFDIHYTLICNTKM